MLKSQGYLFIKSSFCLVLDFYHCVNFPLGFQIPLGNVFVSNSCQSENRFQSFHKSRSVKTTLSCRVVRSKVNKKKKQN